MALGLVGRLAKFTGNGGSKMLADRPAADSKDVSALSQAGVPVVSLRDACAACDEPCDDDGDQANGESSGSVFRGLDVDMDSKLLGSLKGNSGRWIICATGKSDWPHSVTDEKELFAHQVQKSYDAHLKNLSSEPGSSNRKADLTSNGHDGRHTCLIKGISGLGSGFNESGDERLRNVTILCGSQRSLVLDHLEDESSTESVLVFPDYKVVTNVPARDASQLVEEHLSPRSLDSRGRPSVSSRLKSFLLPYYAVILVCSHKRRDKRCHVTADPLIESLSHAIHSLGDNWNIDTRCDDESTFADSPIITPETPSGAVDDYLQSLLCYSAGGDSDSDSANRKEELNKQNRTVGIFKCSHVGGHRYAGNVMIWFPNGVNVWYARVREADAFLIVQETLMKGRLITDLLRGGIGIARPQQKNLLQW